MADHTHLPASPPAKTRRVGYWDQMLRRYPLASPWGLVLQIGATLAGNGLIAWLVISGRMTPFELVLLVFIEALLLIGIAWLQRRLVPADAVESDAMSGMERLKTLGFLLFWLAGVYSFVLFGFVPSGAEMLGALRDPLGYLAGSSIKWPLLITLTLAAIDAAQDRRHFRRHGGMFYSTPGLQGAARGLTLILGGIPFVVPFFGFTIGLKLGVERAHGWLTRGVANPSWKAFISTVLALTVLGLVIGGLVLADHIDRALASGVAWWALCYAAAKFVSELFIVCLPLIASKAKAEDAANAARQASAVSAPKKRRLPG
ncbi:MAG: hypothetical protein ACT4NL_07695 [Pseudomarimonas sp.]